MRVIVIAVSKFALAAAFVPALTNFSFAQYWAPQPYYGAPSPYYAPAQPAPQRYVRDTDGRLYVERGGRLYEVDPDQDYARPRRRAQVQPLPQPQQPARQTARQREQYDSLAQGDLGAPMDITPRGGANPAPATRSRIEMQPLPAPPTPPQTTIAPQGTQQPLELQAQRASAPRASDKRGASLGYASLPSDADPAYSTAIDGDSQVNFSQHTGREIADPTGAGAGVITINTRLRKLYLSLGDGRAMEYGVGVGKQGFSWKGSAIVGRKAFWPGWTPPPEMIERRPELPEHMDGGLSNPLGARALYLFQNNKDTLFRIHGTNEPNSIGHAVSSGCIRMMNADVIDLYQRVGKGAKVVVI